jgi:pimeloyl-ACP methyl ester carboxylesterase
MNPAGSEDIYELSPLQGLLFHSRAWRRFGAEVELVTMPGGNHYFHQHQPEPVSRVLEERCSVSPARAQ